MVLPVLAALMITGLEGDAMMLFLARYILDTPCIRRLTTLAYSRRPSGAPGSVASDRCFCIGSGIVASQAT